MKFPLQLRRPARRKARRPESLLTLWPAGLLACWLALAALGLAPPVAQAADASTALEYKVKAGYLFNFARFIEWPAGCLPTTNSPFVIGVLDGGEAAPVLEQMLAGKNVNGHPMQVRSFSAGSAPKDVHILLVTRAAGKTPEEIRDTLAAAPTLVVGETEQFAERGGSFGFVREADSIRLTLCLEHAVAARLKVSAKLASVARPVKPSRGH
jgi:YfiR/HmsC-like